MNLLQGFAAFLMLMTSCLTPLDAADTQSADIASLENDDSHAQNQQRSLQQSSLAQYPSYFQNLLAGNKNVHAQQPSFTLASKPSDLSQRFDNAESRPQALEFVDKKLAPRFVGKRAEQESSGASNNEKERISRTPPGLPTKRENEMFPDSDFPYPSNKQGHHYVNKKLAPRFVGKRAEQEFSDASGYEMERNSKRPSSRLEEVDKRASEMVSAGTETDFHHLSKRQAPEFDEKRPAPRFVGKRAFRYAARGAPFFIGKRFSLFRPSVSASSSPYLSAEEFKETFRRSDPYFMGKRDSGLDDEDEISLLDNGDVEDEDDDKRGAPRFVGKRGSPRFVGKRGPPRFVGKRGTPYFVGKRGPPRFVGKRGSPRFVGKRGSPRFVGKRGTPYFMGKRGAPRFVGKRGAPRFIGKRGSPRFVGKRETPFIYDKREADNLEDLFDSETDGYDLEDLMDKRFSVPRFVGKREADNNFIMEQELSSRDLAKLLGALSRLQAIRAIKERIRNEKRVWAPGMVGRRSGDGIENQNTGVDENQR